MLRQILDILADLVDLATAAAEDDDAIRRILTDYGMENLYPDVPADWD